MTLSDVDTCELLIELSKRAGIRINYDPLDRTVLAMIPVQPSDSEFVRKNLITKKGE